MMPTRVGVEYLPKPPLLPGSALAALSAAALAALLCGSPAPARCEIYKWTDAQGILHFSDEPPPDGTAEQVEIRDTQVPALPSPSLGEDPGPTALQPAAAPPPKPVVMYSTQWCGYCKAARRYFGAQRVPYTERDIERSPSARREYERLGGNGVPLIQIGESLLRGFSAGGFESLYRR